MYLNCLVDFCQHKSNQIKQLGYMKNNSHDIVRCFKMYFESTTRNKYIFLKLPREHRATRWGLFHNPPTPKPHSIIDPKMWK